jgi:3'(2'), 5'-bisphosphate nucleotidase
MSHRDWEAARQAACRSACVAWEAIGRLYETGSHVEEKEDGPSTEADKLADRIISEELKKEFPPDEYGYLTEETDDALDRLERERVWVIDPIDGTKDFIKRNGNFAMHIAMVERSPKGVWEPAAAAVYRPAMGDMYSAVRGVGARLEKYRGNAPGGETRKLEVSSRAKIEEMRAVISNSHRDSHLDRLIGQFGFADVYSVGSIGIKMCLIAGGDYDVYINPARGKCKEWDSCAPHLILSEAGGVFTDLEGNGRTYNQTDVFLRDGLLATNGRLHEEIRERIAEFESSLAD